MYTLICMGMVTRPWALHVCRSRWLVKTNKPNKAPQTTTQDPRLHGSTELCIPYQLQLLFARMQHSDMQAIATTGLTHSMGFSRSDALQQHDVQELLRVLTTALEAAAPDVYAQIVQKTTVATARVIEANDKTVTGAQSMRVEEELELCVHVT